MTNFESFLEEYKSKSQSELIECRNRLINRIEEFEKDPSSGDENHYLDDLNALAAVARLQAKKQKSKSSIRHPSSGLEQTNIFEFSFGAYFGGVKSYEINWDGENYYLTGVGYNGLTLDFTTPVDVDLLDSIEEILRQTTDWEETYEGEMTTDGYGWSLTYTKIDGGIHSEGFQAWPDNFFDVRDALDDLFMAVPEKE